MCRTLICNDPIPYPKFQFSYCSWYFRNVLLIVTALHNRSERSAGCLPKKTFLKLNWFMSYLLFFISHKSTVASRMYVIHPKNMICTDFCNWPQNMICAKLQIIMHGNVRKRDSVKALKKCSLHSCTINMKPTESVNLMTVHLCNNAQNPFKIPKWFVDKFISSYMRC